MRWWTSLLAAGIALAGCSGSHTADGGGVDGGGVDSGGVDGGRRDAGMTPFDAGPPAPCDTPGAVEDVACGSCGTVQRFCTAELTWAYGACMDEGECMPGTTDTIACGNCGTQTARCTAACVWEAEGACTGEGVCAPGTRTRNGDGCPAGQLRDVLCSDACIYEPLGACAGDPCDAPGALESVPCGMCGTTERFCTVDRVWSYGPCEDEGVCAPGTTDDVACGRCGTQTARCTATCDWLPSGTCTGEGECAPGETARTSAGCPPGQTRLLQCDDACAYTISAGACTASVPVDVTILLDVTGSNADDLTTYGPTLQSRLVAPLLAITDVNVGVSYFAEFPISPYGQTGDNPFEGRVEPTTSSTTINAAISSAVGAGGNDGPDATVEALSVLSGGALAASSVPLTCSPGRVAGGCWRSGAQQVIVVFTDSQIHNGPDPSSDALYSPYSTITPAPAAWPDVRTRMNASNTTLFFLDTGADSTALAQFAEMLADLGQATTDTMNGTTTLGGSSDAIVARVRALAGM